MGDKRTFWEGIESEFPQCCIIFFEDFWCEVRRSKFMLSGRNAEGWYFDMDKNRGCIRCPECIIKEMGIND